MSLQKEIDELNLQIEENNTQKDNVKKKITMINEWKSSDFSPHFRTLITNEMHQLYGSQQREWWNEAESFDQLESIANDLKDTVLHDFFFLFLYNF